MTDTVQACGVEDAMRVFENERHRLVLGHAEHALDRAVPDGSVGLAFLDPPYNIGKKFGNRSDRWPSDEAYAAWCESWLQICLRKLSPNGSLYLMTSTQAMPHLDLYLRRHLTILSRIVWHYDSSGVQAKRHFGSLYEPILHCVNNKKEYVFNTEDIMVEARTGAVRNLIDYRKPQPEPYQSRKVPGNAWYFPRVRYRMPEYEEHPTQKPEALLERIILASSGPNDTVLDPFAGTCTAAAVASRLGRRSISIESHLPYVKIGLRRLGLASELDGERLTPPKKNYVPRLGR